MTSDCPRPSQRQFQDKSYFLGALRTKMSDLTSEIARLGREVDTQQREQSTYLAYDKVGGYSTAYMTIRLLPVVQRVKELAGEVTLAQGELADYNLLLDKLNTDTDR